MFTAEFNAGVQQALEYVQELIDQLDEPEVLSQKWIDEYKVERIINLRKMTTSDVVPVEKLKNLLVPNGYEVEKEQKYILSINITDKASKTNYETFLNKRGIFHSMENESFNSEEFNWSEEEIKGLVSGDRTYQKSSNSDSYRNSAFCV